MGRVAGVGLLMMAGSVAAEEQPAPPQLAQDQQSVPNTTDGAIFAIKSSDGQSTLQLRGDLQVDARLYPDDDPDALSNTFLIRRARPILQAQIGRHFDFNLTPDFGGGTVVLFDAYVDAKVAPGFAIRIGKFKAPVGIEHLQADDYLAFVERAFPASLEANRDVGAQISGEVANGVVAYAAGLFDGAADGANIDLDSGDAKAVEGRIVLRPFKAGKSVLKGLGLGVGGSTEKQSGPAAALSGYKTGGQNTFFSYGSGVAPAGARTRWAPELSFYSGPVGIVAEYVKVNGRLSKTTTTTATATSAATTTTTGPYTLGNDAWEVTASVFLTGDTAGFNGPTIRKAFEPASGRWGALQLAFRANGFEADPNTFTKGFADIAKSARRASAWAVGLDWYLNKNLKDAISFERTTFTGGAANGGDRPTENALLLRSQLSF